MLLVIAPASPAMVTMTMAAAAPPPSATSHDRG
jgi:hypothetical protein